MRTGIGVACGLIVVGLTTVEGAALPTETVEDIVCRATSGENFSYSWGESAGAAGAVPRTSSHANLGSARLFRAQAALTVPILAPTEPIAPQCSSSTVEAGLRNRLSWQEYGSLTENVWTNNQSHAVVRGQREPVAVLAVGG